MQIDAVVTAKHLERRELQTNAATTQQLAAINPLDPAQLENYMLEKSGILNVRPALPAAKSGDEFVRVIPFQILSWAPRIVVFPSFIDKARCDAIIHMANKTMYKSAVAFRPGENWDSEQQIRTSSGK